MSNHNVEGFAGRRDEGFAGVPEHLQPSNLPTRLQEIKARAEKATLGPWTAENAQAGIAGGCAWGVVAETNVVVTHDFVGPADADFIAHAREDIPWLLSQLAASPPLAEGWQPSKPDLETIRRALAYYGAMTGNWPMRANEHIAAARELLSRLPAPPLVGPSGGEDPTTTKTKI